jgi:hypothetical protein
MKRRKKLLIAIIFIAIVFVLMILCSALQAQNDYSKLNKIEKNIVKITVNIKQDSSFFINQLWYDTRTYSTSMEDMNNIVFYGKECNMDVYFLDNEFQGVSIFCKTKKQMKQTIKFIDRNLYRVYDNEHKYKWIFLSTQHDCIVVTTLDKKNKKFIIIAK